LEGFGQSWLKTRISRRPGDRANTWAISGVDFSCDDENFADVFELLASAREVADCLGELPRAEEGPSNLLPMPEFPSIYSSLPRIIGQLVWQQTSFMGRDVNNVLRITLRSQCCVRMKNLRSGEMFHKKLNDQKSSGRTLAAVSALRRRPGAVLLALTLAVFSPGIALAQHHHGGGYHGGGYHGGGYHGGGYHGSGYYGSGYYGSGYYGSGYHGSGYHGSGYHGSGYHGSGYHGSGYHGGGHFNSHHYGSGYSGLHYNNHGGYYGGGSYYGGGYGGGLYGSSFGIGFGRSYYPGSSYYGGSYYGNGGYSAYSYPTVRSYSVVPTPVYATRVYSAPVYAAPAYSAPPLVQGNGIQGELRPGMVLPDGAVVISVQQ